VEQAERDHGEELKIGWTLTETSYAGDRKFGCPILIHFLAAVLAECDTHCHALFVQPEHRLGRNWRHRSDQIGIPEKLGPTA
jgi:hypothetical protein